MIEIVKKYFSNFTKIIPYLIAKVTFEITLLVICFGRLGLPELTSIYLKTRDISAFLNGIPPRGLAAGTIVFLLANMAVQPIFSCFIRVLFRKILKSEVVDQIQIFKKSLSNYWSYVGVVLAIYLIAFAMVFAIFIGSMVPGLGLVIAVALLVFFMYLITIFTPCTEYVIYHDSTASDALTWGRLVGKRYFWIILIVVAAIEGINKLINANAVSFSAIFIGSIVVMILEGLRIMYFMNLCKIFEEENSRA
jgi:hypothetical protein